MTTSVIFDTDAGSDIDDLYALALIINLPNLNLLGVTTVAGDTQARARLIAKMLRLGDREDVPVCAGIRVPEALVAKGGDIALPAARGCRGDLSWTAAPARRDHRQPTTHTCLGRSAGKDAAAVLARWMPRG